MNAPLVCALALAVASSLGGAPAPRPLEVTIQDDALLLHGTDAEVDRAAARMAAAGADRVRLTAGWSVIAPAPRSRRRPAFDAADPAQYPDGGFASLDRAVRAARRHGLDVMVDLAFWAPRWAVRRAAGRPGRQRWAPSATEFGRFAEAVARRYDGSFPDPAAGGRALPAVRLWTTWNEPNHPSFLLPQWRRVGGRWQAAAPHLYRRMHEAGYEALKRVSAGNRVLIGGLASVGDPGRGERRGIAPLRFVRELACVDARLLPLRRRECRGFRPLRADGFAHHPYSFGGGPGDSNRDRDSAQIADLDRLSRLLGELAARGRIEDRLPLYLTEYGYESAPPDPDGVALDDQARHLSHATYLAWRRDDTAMFAQFLLQDLGPDPAGGPAAWRRTWQTGLAFADGREKPAMQAFKLPFWVEPRTLAGRSVVVAFGQVRPGRGAQRVAIEALGGDGVWRTVDSLEARTGGDSGCGGASPEFVTDAGGFYLRALPYEGPVAYRPRWTRSDGAVEHGVPVTAGAQPPLARPQPRAAAEPARRGARVAR